MVRYKDDPRWIIAKFPGKCNKCNSPFSKGDNVFYYPLHKEIFSGECAKAAERDFTLMASDEDMMGGSY